MSTNLQTRAEQQLALFRTAAQPVTDDLAATADELGRRHPDPGSVARADWASDLGATQHVQVARDALAAVRAAQEETRRRIAAVANPADAQTFEDQLRDQLVEEAALRLELRLAEERLAAASTTGQRLAELQTAVSAELRAAEARVGWATEHTTLGTDLRAAIQAPPAATVTADAAALLGGAAFSDADDRLDDLLPTELRARAEDRAEEAVDVLVRANDAARNAADEHDALRGADRPDDAAAELGMRALRLAEGDLAGYVAGAPGRVTAAGAALLRITALPDLSASQAAALAATSARTDAATAEADLATARIVLMAAQEAVADAVLAALVADPDADPETEQSVIDARTDAADAEAAGSPLADARDDYDQPVRDVLDLWEVEVPPGLWAAVEDFTEARRTLMELGAAGHATNLRDALGDAEDILAAALDARDEQTRRHWAVVHEEARRAGRLAAAEQAAVSRRRQYVQGDGPGGRLPTEL